MVSATYVLFQFLSLLRDLSAACPPFLDINFKNDRTNLKHDVEFYSRGFKYNKTSFNNLFEYLIFTEQHGFRDWKTHTYLCSEYYLFQ